MIDDNKKTLPVRIFITTGLISLINALAIQQMRGPGCDDLIIICASERQDFMDTNRKLASLGAFRSVKFVNSTKDLKNLHVGEYSEILNCGMRHVHPKKGVSVVNFDEGASYPCRSLKDFPGMTEVCVTNFLDKIFYYNLPKSIKSTFIPRDIFLSRIKLAQDVLGIKAVVDPKEKNVLFIAHWLFDAVGPEQILEFCTSNINNFIANGFKVYYKPHPRNHGVMNEKIIKYYRDEPLFELFSSNFPIELHPDKFALVTGAFSGSLISLPHYHNIPAAHLDFHAFYLGRAGLELKKFSIMHECYTPPISAYEHLLQLPSAWFRQESKVVCDKFIQSTPPLPKYDLLKAVLDYQSKWYRDLFFTVMGGVNKARRYKLKNRSRTIFLSLIDITRQEYLQRASNLE